MALTIQSFSFLRNTMIVAGYAIDIQGLRNQEAAANHYNCRQKSKQPLFTIKRPTKLWTQNSY